MVALAMTTPSFGSPIVFVDQQNLVGGDGLFSTNFWQTFTPNLTAIDAVEFDLRVDSASASVDLKLYAGAGNGGALLGSSPTQIVASTIFQTYHFDFPSSVALTPGNTYTFQLTDFTTLTPFYPRWSFSNPYAGGLAVLPDGSPVFSGEIDLERLTKRCWWELLG
jgi:hypothetical protein